MKKKTGRPRKTIDWDFVNLMIEARCNGKQIAAHLGVHYDTLADRFKEELEPKLEGSFSSFSLYIQHKRQGGESNILLAQYQKAKEGDNTMLVWWGKNYLGQSDKKDFTPNDKPISFNIRLASEEKENESDDDGQ